MLNMIICNQGTMKELAENTLVKAIKGTVVRTSGNNIHLCKTLECWPVGNFGCHDHDPRLLKPSHQLPKRTVKERKLPQSIFGLTTRQNMKPSLMETLTQNL
jgi:hypothetical protein